MRMDPVTTIAADPEEADAAPPGRPASELMFDLALPESDGTWTREEYYRERERKKPEDT